MNAELLGLFSGFPTHHFPDEIAQVLRENLPRRESLVFISAWPEDYERNNDDSDGMHEMFAECGMAFADHRVIDRRTSASNAVELVRAADCIFLMGGEVTSQMALIRDLVLVPELLSIRAAILGVSAGSMNMGKTTVDIWESLVPYEGLGFADITMIGHFSYKDTERLRLMKAVSMERPVCAMEDESAIFIKNGKVEIIGIIHRIEKGEIRLFTEEDVQL